MTSLLVSLSFSAILLFSFFFLLLIRSCLVIISMEMPQLGQLAILMALITPCIPSMSLIHLTVFFSAVLQPKHPN